MAFTSRTASAAVLLGAHLFGASIAAAHDLRHEISTAAATIVTVRYADGTPFSFEAYEIYGANPDVPFQVGRTDARGQVSFVPDADREWRIRVTSEDGHGVSFTVRASPGMSAVQTRSGPGNRLWPPLVGVAFLFGMFGLVTIFVRRRQQT